jgi:hypothetical protein
MRSNEMRTILLSILLLITLTNDSFACICDNVKHKKLFKEADYVFSGQAISNLTPDKITSQYLDSKRNGIRISFKIEKVFKGKIDKDVIAIIQSGGSCSMLFDLGDRYLIFGRKREKIFDSENIHDPIIRLDSADTRTDEEIIQIRKEAKELELKYEQTIRTTYGQMVDTDLCSCFYDSGKTFKKYMRRRTHSWQQKL